MEGVIIIIAKFRQRQHHFENSEKEAVSTTINGGKSGEEEKIVASFCRETFILA